MRELGDYHHFRKDSVGQDDRVARCEQRVVEILLSSSLGESERDSSVAFELKHHHSTAQFARVLARKRGLPIDACTVGALLHDIYVVTNGRYADHAHLGAPIAQAILDDIGGFTDTERSVVERIVYNHSDKHLQTRDPFVEFGKDADVLDCFLYPGAFDFYLRHKSLAVFEHYLARARTVWVELQLPSERRFDLLAGYGPRWFDETMTVDMGAATQFVAVAMGERGERPAPPPAVVMCGGAGMRIAYNDAAYRDYVDRWGVGRAQSRWGGRTDRATRGADLVAAVNDGGGALTLPRAEAGALLRASAASGGGLLLWPDLEAYELVGADSARLAELGVSDAGGGPVGRTPGG